MLLILITMEDGMDLGVESQCWKKSRKEKKMNSPDVMEKMPQITQVIEETFSVDGMLPNMLKAACLDNVSIYDSVRLSYVNNSYVLLTDELMVSITALLENLNVKTVMELACGSGWLTHWLRKYNKNISYRCVDDKSWEHHDDYLFEVEQGDACIFADESDHVDLFILAWPHWESGIASGIWNSLKPGQYLLYIGEGQYGCCAEDTFFHLNDGHEMEDENVALVRKMYKAFRGVNDYPTLYLK